MKTCLIAVALFAAPIIVVMAMNPKAVKQSLNDAQAWAQKSFPTPEPRKNVRIRRG